MENAEISIIRVRVRVRFSSGEASYAEAKYQLLHSIYITSNPNTWCPRKNATDLNVSNGSCFLLVRKQLFLLKSTTIRINFDIFSSIFGDLVQSLVVKLKISKVQNCFQVETRAATLAIVD